MKITNIIEVPKFISKYITNNIDDIDCQLQSFCKYLLNRKVNSFNINSEIEDNEIYQLEYILDDKLYDIKYFINFYKEKSELDCKFNCLYEMETDLSKSLSNETFTVTIETDDGSEVDTINIYIDSYENNKLTFKSI